MRILPSGFQKGKSHEVLQISVLLVWRCSLCQSLLVVGCEDYAHRCKQSNWPSTRQRSRMDLPAVGSPCG